jgi:hypothetical protein
MQCAFCGTENRPEHKFCGMCGVKLERRQAERRVRPSGVSLKCPSCAHLNESGLKYCGMCGTRVERRMQERRGAVGPELRAGAVANAQLPTPEGAARAKPLRGAVPTPAADLPVPGARRGDPAIFHDESASRSAKLGPQAKGTRTDGSHANDSPAADSRIVDSHINDSQINSSRAVNKQDIKDAHSQVIHSQISGPSFLGLGSQPEGGGEYLLEDEPSRGGLRKLVLLVILAAIIGLVFVQWRSNFRANPKPAPAKAEPASPPGAQSNSQPAAPASADQPAQAATVKDASQKDAASKEDGKSSASAPDGAKPQAESTIVPNANAAATEPASADDKADDKKVADSASTKPSPDPKAPEDARLSDRKPSAALLRAQQYLQGRGVPQNCEQGMIYLRAAAEKNDPGAAIQMAALYSSGHCVKQDRVMAYRWFNSAHELEPANTWIQRNMDQLWAQMTSQERHLAGY